MRKSLCLFIYTLLNITILSQTNYTLQEEDVTIDENGYITSCSYDFSAKTEGTNLIIPETIGGVTIKGISDPNNKTDMYGVFSNKNITSIELPNLIEYIGHTSFISNSLKTIKIPASVINISYYAFAQNQLSSVIFDTNSNLNKIGAGTFKSNSITSIVIPNSVYSIEDYAFNDNNITDVVFKENSKILQIGFYAFSNNKITKINLPADQAGFNGWLDGNDKELSEPPYTITNFNTMYSAIVPYTLTCDDITLDDKGYITSCNPICSNIIIIPDSICNVPIKGIVEYYETNNNSGVFENRNIRKIQLPDNLEKIGSNAFKDNKLTKLYIPANIEFISLNAFYNNHISNITFEKNSKLNTIYPLAFKQNNLTEITLPSDQTGFNGWTDSNKNTIDAPYIISDFSLAYFADIATNIEKEVISNIILYPNPATTEITIEGAEGETINIYNSTGALVIQVRNISNKQSIDISMLPDGLYILKGDKFTSKLIVK